MNLLDQLTPAQIGIFCGAHLFGLGCFLLVGRLVALDFSREPRKTLVIFGISLLSTLGSLVFLADVGVLLWAVSGDWRMVSRTVGSSVCVAPVMLVAVFVAVYMRMTIYYSRHPEH